MKICFRKHVPTNFEQIDDFVATATSYTQYSDTVWHSIRCRMWCRCQPSSYQNNRAAAKYFTSCVQSTKKLLCIPWKCLTYRYILETWFSSEFHPNFPTILIHKLCLRGTYLQYSECFKQCFFSLKFSFNLFIDRKWYVKIVKCAYQISKLKWTFQRSAFYA